MGNKIVIITVFMFAAFAGCAQNSGQTNTEEGLRELTAEEKRVIQNKGTERPFSGKYDEFYEEGTYVCKQCGAELYQSADKFDAHCGWPAFDDEIEGAVERVPDGFRTEIICSNCGGHLGHVFLGEGFTEKDTRHCVNSVSMEFIPTGSSSSAKRDTAYFAGGCFWGVEYYLEQMDGVKSVVSGYMGGEMQNPTYRDVSSKRTNHAEVVQVIFNPSKTGYQELAKMFFEIHDPTQVNRQGPDIGKHYRSEVFYTDEAQKETTEKLIDLLEIKGYDIATKVTPANTFWEAEKYHQDYYENKGGTPYCHGYTKRF